VIRLGPLSDADTRTLLGASIGQETVDQETVSAVLERAGGNPLFAQEFARLIRDRASRPAPSTETPVPRSITSIIAARLDTLPPRVKSVLQDASVIRQGLLVGSTSRDGWDGRVRSARSPPRADEAGVGQPVPRLEDVPERGGGVLPRAGSRRRLQPDTANRAGGQAPCRSGVVGRGGRRPERCGRAPRLSLPAGTGSLTHVRGYDRWAAGPVPKSPTGGRRSGSIARRRQCRRLLPSRPASSGRDRPGADLGR